MSGEAGVGVADSLLLLYVVALSIVYMLLASWAGGVVYLGAPLLQGKDLSGFSTRVPVSRSVVN